MYCERLKIEISELKWQVPVDQVVFEDKVRERAGSAGRQ